MTTPSAGERLAPAEPPVEVLRPYRVPAAALTGGLIAFGLWIVARGMSDLRWAHRYRQQSGEGVAFFSAGVQLVAGGVLALAGACALLVVATRFTHRAREVLLVAGCLVLLSLAFCTILAFWVVGHGERCIGPCG